MNILALHKLSCRFLIYGMYTVLCHTVAVFFNVITNEHCSSAFLTLRYVPFLEHSIMSLVLILAGGLLIEITLRDTKEKSSK